MTPDRQDLAALADRALLDSKLTAMRPVVEKELLHYDILFCMEEAGLLDGLVFQGGTCLRLCYGAGRFSEDLDFAGGPHFASSQLKQLARRIEDYLSARYGLQVTVKEPSGKDAGRGSELRVDRWQVVVITAPKQRDLPAQRVRIEVASVPAHTRETLPLYRNYDFLPDGYEDTLVHAESLDEIMADKLIALPATQKYVRYRDLWDLAWLYRQGARPQPELVAKKAQDYRLPNYDQLVAQCRASLPQNLRSPAFLAEMRRFLPSDTLQRTLAKPKYLDHMQETLTRLLAPPR